MSEFINNSAERKKKLKQLILKLHDGESAEKVRQELIETLKQVPYGEVVEVEQELIQEGIPEQEILKLCDLHSAVLDGNIDLSSSKHFSPGHPVDVLINENKEIVALVDTINVVLDEMQQSETIIESNILTLTSMFNNLYDIDKHYLRKEYLIFPYLEKQGISGPPKVMWGKHDEIRELLKGSIQILKTENLTKEDLDVAKDVVIKIVLQSIKDMVRKEEEILLPMCLDALSEVDWYEIHKQSIEIGFCLYDPQEDWKPEGVQVDSLSSINKSNNNIQLPSGSFAIDELLCILNTLPVDITFVDRNDKVKYFSQGVERFFQRNRAILNRDVRHCHPPASAHIVDKIIDDFRTGKASRAPFWINMGGKMIYIEYFALRNEKGEYMGTLEVSHNISKYKELEGEQRILSYSE